MKNTFTLFISIAVFSLYCTTLTAQKNILPKHEFWVKSGINKHSGLNMGGFSIGLEANTTLYKKFGIGLGIQGVHHRGNSYYQGDDERIPYTITDLHVHYTALKGHLRLSTGICHFYFPTNSNSRLYSNDFTYISSFPPYNQYYSINKSNYIGPSIGAEFRMALPKNCLLSIGAKGQYFVTKGFYENDNLQYSVLNLNIGLGFGK